MEENVMARSVCPQCKEVFYVPKCKEHLIHCSRECYQDSRKLPVDQVRRLAKVHRGNRAKVAKEMEIPYATFYKKIVDQKLNSLFQKRGGWYCGG
jgi:transcriptional regulator with PAS, ATPase and Fis domain